MNSDGTVSPMHSPELVIGVRSGTALPPIGSTGAASEVPVVATVVNEGGAMPVVATIVNESHAERYARDGGK